MPIFALLGFALAIIGSRGAWINLPVSGVLPGIADDQILYVDMIYIFRSLFVATILLAAMSRLLRFRFISVQLSVVSLVVMLCFIVYGIFEDQQLLIRYMEQSDERMVLQRFISAHYWPNVNPDQTVKLIREYEYLWDRLDLCWNILGSGYVTAFLGALILLFIDLRRASESPAVVTVAAVLHVVAITILLVPYIRADKLHRDGDILLDSGMPVQALSAYQEAYLLDPMLEYSMPFLTKVSHAYYRLEGKYSDTAVLYLQEKISTDIRARRPDVETQRQLAQLHLLADKVTSEDIAGDTLRDAVLRQVPKADADLLMSQGVIDYDRGDLIASMTSLHNALKADNTKVHTKYILAHVLKELDRHTDSLALLESITQSVWNKQMRADIICTIGDVYTKLEKPKMARDSYTSCHELDSVYNYRAVLSLGGT